MPRSSRVSALAATACIAVLAGDQLSKAAVRARSADLPLDLGAGLRLELTYNSGISFSRFAGHGTILAVVVALIAVALLIALLVSPPHYRASIGLILGGAIGNLVDRVRFDGAVVDFICIGAWPTFNLADAAIVVGSVILSLQVLFGRHT